MRFLHGIGIAAAILLSPITIFGIWLLATPDYDGGRQAVGGMIVAASATIAGLFCAIYLLIRSRVRARTRRPSDPHDSH
jgi:hypothetical protein